MPIFQNRDYAAFLFDMDGTMLDSTSVVERTWKMWADLHGVDPEPLLTACHGVQSGDTIRCFGPDHLDVDAESRWLHDAEMADIEGIVRNETIAALIEGIASTSWAIVTSAPRNLALLRLAAVGLPLPQILIAAEDVKRGSLILKALSKLRSSLASL